MRTSLVAPTARKRDMEPMENHANILTISLSYLGYKRCWQMPRLHRRCATERNTSTNLVLSRTYSMATIISHYLTPLSLVVRLILSSTFLMSATLPLAFRRMVSHHSRGVIRHVGQSSFSITTSLLNYVSRRSIVSTLPQSRVQKSLGIGIHSVGHSLKN